MDIDELVDLVEDARARLEQDLLRGRAAGIDMYVIGGQIAWEDLDVINWEAHRLGMQVVLGVSSFGGGLPVLRFAAGAAEMALPGERGGAG